MNEKSPPVTQSLAFLKLKNNTFYTFKLPCKYQSPMVLSMDSQQYKST